MKNSWQTQPGPLLLRPETNLSRYQKKITWPFLYFWLCFSQINDILSFGFFLMFLKKSPIHPPIVQRKDKKNEKKCRTRIENSIAQLLQNNDNFLPIFKVGFLLIFIMVQLPVLQTSWREISKRKSEKIVQQQTQVVNLSLPEEIDFSSQTTIKLDKNELTEKFTEKNASWSAGLTQNDKVNLALAAFYQNDWANYQSWLNAAKAMDPNATFFSE